MKPEFWVFSVFSLVSLSSYFYFCHKDEVRPELRVAIYFLISGLSMAGAYNIVCFAFSPSTKDPNESLIENDLLLGVALLAGALSLAWYSIEAVVSEIFASRKNRNKKKDSEEEIEEDVPNELDSSNSPKNPSNEDRHPGKDDDESSDFKS